MEKGKRDREHRDTGRQHSEPEEGKHARQPEGRTGRTGGLGVGTISGPSDRPTRKTLLNRQITAAKNDLRRTHVAASIRRTSGANTPLACENCQRLLEN
jgi:hypothetical protein